MELGGLKLIDPDKLKAVGRMAGATYARSTDHFDLPRPVVRQA
jgi:hypothetical protein